MSDKDIEQGTLVEEAPETAVAEAAEAPAEDTPPSPARARKGNAAGRLALLTAVVALAGSGYLAWQTWRTAGDSTVDDTLSRLDDRVAASGRTLADIESRMADVEARDPGVDAAVDALRRDFDERIRLLDSLPARLSTLESSVASLAGVSEGARDAWILAESEYYMQIANAQLQLANNPHLAALALRMADERIVQLANPALTGVRGALSDELAALEVMKKPDIEGATLMLASLARVVESLPLAGPEEEPDEAPEAGEEPGAAGRAWASVKNAMSGLVRVTPPDRAKLVRLSPDAEFFLRNNVALQLQSARLALLRGEQAVFEQTLDDTTALLHEYFDLGSTQVAGALETIAEIRGHAFTSDTPDISGSLQLLRQYRTLQENAQ